MYDVLGVYLVDFKKNIGGEFSGKHYALILNRISKKDNTILVAPITSKKKGKRYKGGFTIDCKKYQKNPTCDKAFVKIRKIREIDAKRIFKKKIYDLDKSDIEKLEKSFYSTFLFLNKKDENALKITQEYLEKKEKGTLKVVSYEDAIKELGL